MEGKLKVKFEEVIIKEEIIKIETEEREEIQDDDYNESVLYDKYDFMKKMKLERNMEDNDLSSQKSSDFSGTLYGTDKDSKDAILSDSDSDIKKRKKEDIEFFPYSESDPSSVSSDNDEDLKTTYSCQKCDFKTKYRGNLKQHQDARHSGKIELCQYCGNKYSDPSNLNRHVRIAHLHRHKKSSILRAYNCIYCAYTTTRKGNLNLHMNSLHTLENIFPCRLCSYVGTRIDSYRRHMQAMHQTKEKHFKCSRCSFQTSRRDFLHKHFEEDHAALKVHPCNFCDYKATYLCNLTRHIQRKHSD